jgi:hypothetical protein
MSRRDAEPGMGVIMASLGQLVMYAATGTGGELILTTLTDWAHESAHVQTEAPRSAVTPMCAGAASLPQRFQERT